MLRKVSEIEPENWDQYAEKYHEHIISPFQSGVYNPVHEVLAKIPNKRRLVAADIGCGPGDFISKISPEFKHVYAFDFSPKMIEVAREKNRDLTNVTFQIVDTRELSKQGVKVDVAFAINSILQPSFSDVRKALSEIYASLKEGGYFLGIFPSMDAIIYYLMLVHEREIVNNPNEEEAIVKTRRIVEAKKYCFIRAIFDDAGEKQKLYYKFELKNRLEEAGFKEVKIRKVLYPWGTHGDFEAFSGKPKMWDWFVFATK